LRVLGREAWDGGKVGRLFPGGRVSKLGRCRCSLGREEFRSGGGKCTHLIRRQRRPLGLGKRKGNEREREQEGKGSAGGFGRTKNAL